MGLKSSMNRFKDDTWVVITIGVVVVLISILSFHKILNLSDRIAVLEKTNERNADTIKAFERLTRYNALTKEELK